MASIGTLEQEWQQDELEMLWAEFKVEAARGKTEARSSETEEEGRVARAKGLGGNGVYGRACDASISQGMHATCEQVQVELDKLHLIGAPRQSRLSLRQKA